MSAESPKSQMRIEQESVKVKWQRKDKEHELVSPKKLKTK